MRTNLLSSMLSNKMRLFSCITTRLVVFVGLLLVVHVVTQCAYFDTGSSYFVPYLLDGFVELLTILYA